MLRDSLPLPVFRDELCAFQDAVLVVIGWVPDEIVAVGEPPRRLKDDVDLKLSVPRVRPVAILLSWLARDVRLSSEMLEFSGSPPDSWPLLLDCTVREEEMLLSRVEPTSLPTAAPGAGVTVLVDV